MRGHSILFSVEIRNISILNTSSYIKLCSKFQADVIFGCFLILSGLCIMFQFCHNNQKAQKYLLGGIEMLVGDVHKATLMPKVPHILKELYECDIVDEEVLIEWGGKVRLFHSSRIEAVLDDN